MAAYKSRGQLKTASVCGARALEALPAQNTSLPPHLVLVQVGVQQLAVGRVDDGGAIRSGKHSSGAAAPAPGTAAEAVSYVQEAQPRRKAVALGAQRLL